MRSFVLSCAAAACCTGPLQFAVGLRPGAGSSSGFLERVPNQDVDEELMNPDAMEMDAPTRRAQTSSRPGLIPRTLKKCALAGIALTALFGAGMECGKHFGASTSTATATDNFYAGLQDKAAVSSMSSASPFGFASVRSKFPRFNERGGVDAIDSHIDPSEGPVTVPVQVGGGPWSEEPGAAAPFDFPKLDGKQEVGFGGKLLGTLLSMDLINMGQIPCGCQTNFYLTKAPNNDSPMTCDSGANGYGCPELDFMEGNSQALGTTLHLCDSTGGARGVFTCGWQSGCLTSNLAGKQGGGATCDAWGCQTKTVGMKHWGQNAYGPGGYIDSNKDLNMQVYFQPVAGNLENVWVQLSQKGKDPLVYSACVNADYKRAVTHDLMTGWSHHSTYWGGFDGMEWLNGPCPNHPSTCSGNAADHIHNVKVYKIDNV
ncbi:unnamed protein product [Amoebophrya sp. A120]|nr:unnamed protein product [Amoebophrya sp. A120]|eukprot:GSA120T00001641001.1